MQLAAVHSETSVPASRPQMNGEQYHYSHDGVHEHGPLYCVRAYMCVCVCARARLPSFFLPSNPQGELVAQSGEVVSEKNLIHRKKGQLPPNRSAFGPKTNPPNGMASTNV